METRAECPCEAVKKLERLVERHDRLLAEEDTQLAVIRNDLSYIREKLDKRERFNGGVLSAAVNMLLTILLGYLAVRMGLQ